MSFFSESTFKLFYIEFFGGIRIYIFSKCGSMELAEDLTQEAFIRLWNHRDTVEISKAKSFVFTVVNNLFLDHVRHQKVKSTYVNAFIARHDNHDPLFIMEMEEFKVKLEKTIHSMPEASRVVFLMSRMEKMTYAQIADSLDLSVKAIEKRMQKALEVMSLLTAKKI
ncbi:MAG: sigma-70 family RNA polymerase sigma factor [Saprospiraceae bacterium]